jgi:hypothetical protein
VPVNSTHPDYDANLIAWQRARDVIAGEDAVKAAGIRYLPRLDSQTDDEYAAYKCRTSFFNASARTADGFVGLIFRREPTFKIPQKNTGVGKSLDAFIEDADMRGTSLTSYAKNVTTEVIAVGRAGTLVDWEEVAEKRAFAVLYAAEQIINWHSERVNGRNVLTLVVLKEVSLKPGDESDVFEPETVEQLRVLKLLPSGSPAADGAESWSYQVEIWQQEKKAGYANSPKRAKAEWTKIETRTPLRLGKPLPLIPFIFHGPRHFLPDVDRLPLADIFSGGRVSKTGMWSTRNWSRVFLRFVKVPVRSAYSGSSNTGDGWQKVTTCIWSGAFFFCRSSSRKWPSTHWKPFTTWS